MRDDAERAQGPSPRRLVAFATLGLLTLGVGYWVWPRPIDPARVLVVVRGVSEDAAARVVSGVRGPLSVGGLRVLEVQSDRPPTGREDSLAMAREGRTAWVIDLEVETLETRERGPIDPAFAHVRARAQIRAADKEAPPWQETEWSEAAAFADTLDRAIVEAADRLGSAIADPVHLTLMERFSETRSSDRISNDALQRASERFEELGRDQDPASCAPIRAPAGLRCLSTECVTMSVFGRTRSQLFARTADTGRRTRLVGRRDDPAPAPGVTRLVTVDAHDLRQRVFATAPRYPVVPTVSRDGRYVAAVEEWPTGLGLVLLDVGAARRIPLARFERPIRSVQLSDDGSEVLILAPNAPDAADTLLALRTQPGANLRVLGAVRDAAWLHAGARDPDASAPSPSVAALLDPSTDEGGAGAQPAVLDPQTGAELARLADAPPARQIAGAAGGAFVFTWVGSGGCGIGRWDPDTSATHLTVTDRCLLHPRLDADHVLGLGPTALYRVAVPSATAAHTDEMQEPPSPSPLEGRDTGARPYGPLVLGGDGARSGDQAIFHLHITTRNHEGFLELPCSFASAP